MRAAVYVRVSRDEQTKGHSLDTQVADAEDFAEREGLTVVAVYREEGVSGAKTSRPELDRMLAAAEIGDFDVLLVRHVDRLTRDAEHALHLSNLLNSRGIQIYALQEGMRDTAGGDRLTYGIRALVAEEERKRTTERMIRGKREAAREGKWHGGERPFGTVLVGGDSERCERPGKCSHKGHTLGPHEHETAALRRVYRWIVEDGQSAYQAADRLNAEGVTTVRGKKWSSHNLRHLLRRPRLMGDMRSWGEPIPHPEIFTPVEWARLQEAMKVTTKKYSAKGERMKYPLSGRIICGCGSHWIGASRKGKRWYRCKDHPSYANPNGHVCDWTDRRWLSADLAEAALRELLWEEYFASPGVLEVKALEYLASVEPVDLRELGTAKQRVTKLEDKLADLYLRDDLDSAAAARAIEKVRADLDTAREQLEELERQAEQVAVDLSWWAELVDFKASLDTMSWRDLWLVHEKFGDKIGEAAEAPQVTQIADRIRGFLSRGDLEPVIRLLNVRLRLTGRDTFEVEGWLDLGPRQVAVALGDGFTSSDPPPATGSR